MNDIFFRLRIRFAKEGRLLWLSHLELTRCMERLIRRSGLPYAVTQGFNRHMRHAPGPALPVGTVGLNELFDVWLTEYVPEPQVISRLQAVSGFIPIHDVCYVPVKDKGLQATHTLEHYRLLLEAPGMSSEQLESALESLIGQGELTLERKHKQKIFDLGRIVAGKPSCQECPEAGEQHMQLDVCLRALPEGSLRPEILVSQIPGLADSVRGIWRLSIEAEES
jgi:radical SAM-linked protein